EEGGNREREHDRVEGVGVSQGRRFAVSKPPQLLDGSHLSVVKTAGNSAITLSHVVHESHHRHICWGRLDAIATKWKFVLAFKIAPQTAIPTAPPRLRIMLNRPLAYFSRSGGSLPSPR